MNNDRRKMLELIRECLVDYSTPLYIVGNIDDLNLNTNNIESVENVKRNFIIYNNNYPTWVTKAHNNSGNIFNMVIFKNFDSLNSEEQELFIDILCRNKISSEDLPEDLKIIINSEKECKLIPKIDDVVQKIRL